MDTMRLVQCIEQRTLHRCWDRLVRHTCILLDMCAVLKYWEVQQGYVTHGTAWYVTHASSHVCGIAILGGPARVRHTWDRLVRHTCILLTCVQYCNIGRSSKGRMSPLHDPDRSAVDRLRVEGATDLEHSSKFTRIYL